MTILSLAEVAVEFGATTVLRDVSFTVAAGERWGVVGRNGAGKSTLFRLITGGLAPSRGSVFRAPQLRFALLDQHRDFGDADTVWTAAAAGHREALRLERSLAEQAERMAQLGDRVTEADLERFGRDQEAFAHAGGYDFHARVDAVLQGLGFDAEESRTRPLAGLSGGERGRVGLAAQLAAPADVVLLDEPTNHLDLETIAWLKQYLGEFGETVLVISHDRAFLDDAVDHVLHVEQGTAFAYRGGYSSFVTQRGERRLAQQRAADRQRAAIAREEDYIRRNIAGRNSAQARGRRSRLARLPRLSPPPEDPAALVLRLEAGARGGDQVLVADRLTVTVGDRVLVRDLGAVARRGDVIALVGPNGAGKSTLIATLLGERAPAAGAARLGAGIVPGWFRQDLAQVPLGTTVYDAIADVRPEWGRGAVQNHLGCFGFSGDEVLRDTTHLSGGERARLALALLVLAGANLLVLDEPTNHLDVESIEALEDALEAYDGTVLLVSHDRAFLRELATRVWAFDGSRLTDFDGPFVEWEQAERDRAARRRAEAAPARAAPKARAEPPPRDADREARNARQRAEREAARWEAEVQRLEVEAAALDARLADPGLYGDAAGAQAAATLVRERDAVRAALDAAVARWAEAVEAASA